MTVHMDIIYFVKVAYFVCVSVVSVRIEVYFRESQWLKGEIRILNAGAHFLLTPSVFLMKIFDFQASLAYVSDHC